MMVVLRLLYMMVGWMAMLPITPIFCLLAWIFYRKNTNMTNNDIWSLIGDQIIYGIKQNVEFIKYGL